MTDPLRYPIGFRRQVAGVAALLSLGALGFLGPVGCSAVETGSLAQGKEASGSIKGVWLANALPQAQASHVIEEAQALGLNTLLPNVEYAPAREINALAARARGKGIATHAWVERGIKASSPPTGADAALYLPCDDGGADHGYTKWYLDVRKPSARAKFLDDALQLVGGLEVDALHWDDHLGYNTLNLGCVTTTNRAALQSALTGLVGELKARVRRAKPGMKLIFSHNNTYWAKEKFLADWSRWGLDGLFVQAYVSKSFATEVGKAKHAGAMGLGIHGEDPAIVANTKRALDAGLSVIYFKFPPRQHRAALSAILKAQGPHPAVTPSAVVSGTPVDVGGTPAAGPSYPKPVDPSTPKQVDPIDPKSVTPDDARAACAALPVAVKNAWAESCRSANPGRVFPAGKSTCELRACMATGGGYSCNTVRYFHRDHFCDLMLPLMR